MTPDERGGQRQDARSLIEAGEAAYPADLRAAMQRHRDEEATAALDVQALSQDYGVQVIGAAVYGLPDQEQTLVYLYVNDAGRTARWYAPYETPPAQPPPQEAQQAEEQEAEPEPEADETAIEPGETEPWEGYGQQSVAEVLADPRLAETSPEAVRVYETAHRNRKGILSQLGG